MPGKVPSVALQLYSLRDELADDFEGVVREVAAAGYAGVEPFAYPQRDALAEGRLFRELGLQVPSFHAAVSAGEDSGEGIEAARAVDSQRIIIAGFGRGEAWDTRAKIEANCALINRSAADAAAAGMQLGYHNHWWEFDTLVDGRPVWRHMLDQLEKNVFFQIDTYWAQVGGADVVSVLTELGARNQLLHVKDGPADDPLADMVAVGSGVMDWSSIFAVSDVDWIVVELDRCATDMLQAVRDSCAWLTGEGYARGKG
ncbi:MAG: sugar phosphate isomerase/epimerase [Anaerolineaceae bacterium]|nr:sugar phosphate isomerase/epimerase [Anaerolineaceae bacterium]